MAAKALSKAPISSHSFYLVALSTTDHFLYFPVVSSRALIRHYLAPLGSIWFAIVICTTLLSLSFHFFKQNDTMDVLDEKQNGAPPMEVDEVVSVGDRKSFKFLYRIEG